MCYIDEDGQFWWWALGFALTGAYLGGASANDDWNPANWDWGKTWGNMVGGAIQGGLSFFPYYYSYQAVAATIVGNPFTIAGIILRWFTVGINMTSIVSTTASLINNFDNGVDIIRGNFLYNSKTIGGKIFQGLSRGSWESVQQKGGYLISHFRNGFKKGIDVGYFHGTTVVNTDNTNHHRGLTLGNMINGWRIYDKNNSMLYHEYGHTLQSRLAGPIYLPYIGLPSALAAGNDNGYWTEVLANQLSYIYFGADTWNQTAGSQKDKYGNPIYPLTY